MGMPVPKLVAPALGPGPQFLLSKQDGEYRLAAIFIAAAEQMCPDVRFAGLQGV